MTATLSDYERIASAIRYLDQHAAEQPGLAEVARAAGLSEFHFQRLFRRWAGVSPKRFLQYITADRARDLLLERRTVLDTALETGLSGPGRLHDLMVSVQALTPGEIRRRGEGMTIRWGLHPSPFGECLIAVTERGICGLAFVEPGEQEAALDEWRWRWTAAEFRRDQRETRPAAERAFGGARRDPLAIYLEGTNFQIQVWEALLRIPPGRIVFYEDVARAIGHPAATRAVASAVGDNEISWLIPCHRVIRKTGGFGGYRWGLPRKSAMLVWEAAQATAGD